MASTATAVTAFGPPDADFEELADAPDVAFGEPDDDLETPDDGEPDGLDR